MEKEKKENQINIQLTPEMAEGTYSNFAIIAHSPSEFVIDFVRIMPGTPQAPVKARIILSPEHAKRLQQALLENIAKYESQFGPIKKSDNGFMPPIMGFGGEA